jgi:hypothetical protein
MNWHMGKHTPRSMTCVMALLGRPTDDVEWLSLGAGKCDRPDALHGPMGHMSGDRMAAMQRR